MRTKKELEDLIQVTRQKHSLKHQEIVALQVAQAKLKAELERNQEKIQERRVELDDLDNELLDYTEDFRIKEYKDE